MPEQLIETCWRLVSVNGNEFKCGIYGANSRREVRVTCVMDGAEARVHCEVVENIHDGRKLAQQWLRGVLDIENFRQPS
jgi:hypothetical protein